MRRLLALSFVLLSHLAFVGCGSGESEATSREGRLVMVDSITLEPVVVDSAVLETAVNPETGEPTLKPALYCSACGEWHIVPPLEQLNRLPKAGVCQKSGEPLTFDGPWPDIKSDSSEGSNQKAE